MLKFISGDIKNQKTACLVVLVCENEEIHDHPEIIALVENAKKIAEFTGKKDDLLVLYDPADIRADRILFAGLGKRGKIDAEAL